MLACVYLGHILIRGISLVGLGTFSKQTRSLRPFRCLLGRVLFSLVTKLKVSETAISPSLIRIECFRGAPKRETGAGNALKRLVRAVSQEGFGQLPLLIRDQKRGLSARA